MNSPIFIFPLLDVDPGCLRTYSKAQPPASPPTLSAFPNVHTRLVVSISSFQASSPMWLFWEHINPSVGLILLSVNPVILTSGRCTSPILLFSPVLSLWPSLGQSTVLCRISAEGAPAWAPSCLLPLESQPGNGKQIPFPHFLCSA